MRTCLDCGEWRPNAGYGRCSKCYARRRATSDGIQNVGRAPKLTDEQRDEIRSLDRRFVARREIAKQFGVSVVTIRDIVTRKAKP